MERRFYWLKFKEDFFGSKRMKKLRKMAGGDTYIIIYLKMQLKALRSEGVLTYTGLEENFADELALDIDENPEDVRMVLAYLMSYELCECSDNIHYFLPYVVENTGSETDNARRVRAFREREKLKALPRNDSVMELKENCNAEIEKEKEIEKEIEHTEKKQASPRVFKAPTLDEVKAYAREAKLDVDCDRFFQYFTTPNDAGQTWIDSKGNKVKNWKQKLQTWARKDTSSSNGSRTPTKWEESYRKWHPESERSGSHVNLDEIKLDLSELDIEQLF